MASGPLTTPAAPTPAAPTVSVEQQKERLEVYKIIVEMADRVSQRRQTANSFYLSINTLLVSGSAYIGNSLPNTKNAIIVTTAGLATSFLWLKAIESYKTLNNAKFAVIHDIESRLCEKPFSDEWAKIDPAKHGKKHRPFYRTEHKVPFLFMGVFILEGLSLIPWHRWAERAADFWAFLSCL